MIKSKLNVKSAILFLNNLIYWNIYPLHPIQWKSNCLYSEPFIKIYIYIYIYGEKKYAPKQIHPYIVQYNM